MCTIRVCFLLRPKKNLLKSCVHPQLHIALLLLFHIGWKSNAREEITFVRVRQYTSIPFKDVNNRRRVSLTRRFAFYYTYSDFIPSGHEQDCAKLWMKFSISAFVARIRFGYQAVQQHTDFRRASSQEILMAIKKNKNQVKRRRRVWSWLLCEYVNKLIDGAFYHRMTMEGSIIHIFFLKLNCLIFVRLPTAENGLRYCSHTITSSCVFAEISNSRHSYRIKMKILIERTRIFRWLCLRTRQVVWKLYKYRVYFIHETRSSNQQGCCEVFASLLSQSSSSGVLVLII